MECAQVTENKDYGPRPKYRKHAWLSCLARVYLTVGTGKWMCVAWGARAQSTSSSIMWTCLPFEGPPEPRTFASVDAALSAVSAHLQRRGAAAHKERVDLAALQGHTGQSFAQHILIPDELHASLKQLHGVAPVLLLPPNTARSSTVAGEDAVVLFMDMHGALKGLPPNQRATMLLNACGLSSRGPARGDAFVARLRHTGSDGLSLGGEAPPQMIVERDWLEAAQAAHRDAGNSGTPAIEQELVRYFEELRRRELKAKLSGSPADAASPRLTANQPNATVPAAASGAAATAATSPVAAAGIEGAAARTGDATACEGGSAAAASNTSAAAYSFEDGDNEKGGGKGGSEASVAGPVPAGTKAKHVRCTFRDEWLKVEVNTLPEGSRTVIDGRLFQEIVPGDCTWSLEDDKAGGRKLIIGLEKKVAMRWIMLCRPE